MTDQQIAEVFTKAKPVSKKPAAQPDKSQRVGVLGKPSPPDAIPGRFDSANLPQKGEMITYYDGEGGGSRDSERSGRVIDVVDAGGRNPKIRVLSRTGNPINIVPEAARPYQAK